MTEKYTIDRVIAGGYCVGCGLCRHMAPESFTVHIDDFGRPQANRTNSLINETVDLVCPFSDEGMNETDLAAKLFPNNSSTSPDFGSYVSLYAGYVTEGKYRDEGSSGGLGTWLAAELLRLDLVDVVVSVGAKEGEYEFRYTTSTVVDDVRGHSKSRYYPATCGNELKDAFRFDRVAIVGLPCFIKGIRRLAETDAAVKEKLAYAISLVCGHLKARSFGQLLAWQLGVHPSDLVKIDYRLKIPGRAASRYGIEVCSTDGTRKMAPMEGLVGANWGHGLLKIEACDYCDDVFGETADVSIGDAWLPKYERDSSGTNVVVIRNKQIAEIIVHGAKEHRLSLDPLTASEVSASQAGGLRHRRDGLRYRLALKEKAGLWAPRKRVKPSLNHLSPKAKEIQNARLATRDLSHKLFATALSSNDLRIFIDGIRPSVANLDRLQRGSASERFIALGRRILRPVKTLFKTIKG